MKRESTVHFWVIKASCSLGLSTEAIMAERRVVKDWGKCLFPSLKNLGDWFVFLSCSWKLMVYWNESSRGPCSFWGTEACDLWKETTRAEIVLRRLRQVFIAVFNYLVGSYKEDRAHSFAGQQKDKGKSLNRNKRNFRYKGKCFHRENDWILKQVSSKYENSVL